MRVHLAVPAALRAAFLATGVSEAAPGAASVVAVPENLADWPSTLDALTAVFSKSKAAATAGSPIVFVVSSDALLGRTGPLAAMAANGVVSAARTLAVELRKAGVPINCVGRAAESPVDATVQWTMHLLQGGAAGPTGELIQLGGVQVGKALS